MDLNKIIDLLGKIVALLQAWKVLQDGSSQTIYVKDGDVPAGSSGGVVYPDKMANGIYKGAK